MGNDVEFGQNAGQGKPDKKRFRETSKRLRQGKETNLSHRPSIDWRLDQRSVCDKEQSAADIVPVSELCDTLMKSRTAKSLLAAVKAGTLSIVYDAQTPISQFYPETKKGAIVAVNPHRPRGDLLNLLTRELRRAWQHSHGALLNPLEFEPDEAILVNRAQQADVMMISIKVAWELKLVGESASWDALLGSPLADVGRSFEVKAQTDFRTLSNGQAARAAYDKFFEDSRTKLHDKRIIHQMLLDETGYIKSRRQPRRVSMDLFQRLGELPHGRNYLAMRADRMPTDQCYATVEDRSNANFLWFIKFERSFHEKEMQLIEESVKLSAEIIDFAKWSTQRREANGQA